MEKFDLQPTLSPSCPRDHDTNKLESTQHENASTKVAALLVNWFLKKILKEFLYWFLLFKSSTHPLLPNHCPGDHDLIKLNLLNMRILPNEFN